MRLRSEYDRERGTWGTTIRWTGFFGNWQEVQTGNCQTRQEAEEDALRGAIKHGWTPRRWWQWWRWRDTP